MPTAEEMRSMSWQCIAAGANGLIYYTYGTLGRPTNKTPFEKAWADVCAAAEDVRRYIPVMLSVEEPPAVSGAPDAWGVRLWRKDGDVYLLAVNAQDRADEAALVLSEEVAVIASEFGPDAKLDGGRRVCIALGPNQSAMYRISRETRAN